MMISSNRFLMQPRIVNGAWLGKRLDFYRAAALAVPTARVCRAFYIKRSSFLAR